MTSWLAVVIQIALFLGMLIGLFGMIIPVFPGPLVLWVLTLVYGLIFGFEMPGLLLFVIISILAIVGMLSDNVLMIGKARQGGARWGSILLASFVGFVGSILLTPIGGIALTLLVLYLMEYAQRKDKDEAWEATKSMMLGWGWAFVVRFGLGVIMIVLWGIWAWM
jgi:uncharacterized protein YqgC (DUF456 family)